MESDTYMINDFKLKKGDELDDEKLKKLFFILSDNKKEINPTTLTDCIESITKNLSLTTEIMISEAILQQVYFFFFFFFLLLNFFFFFLKKKR